MSSQQALGEARAGNPASLYEIRERRGDQALKDFAAARFDPDPMVRYIIQGMAGDSYESLLFLLPMLKDAESNVAINAMGGVTSISRPRAQFQRLGADVIVPLIDEATQKQPNLVRSSSTVLLLLAQYKDNSVARKLLSRLIQQNGLNVSLAKTPASDWNNAKVAALVARCEVGTLTTDQVLYVLRSSVTARNALLNCLNYLNNETLQRYAISLLWDTTVTREGGEDTDRTILSRDAAFAFHLTTKLDVEFNEVNGVPHYAPETIARLYKFYGLSQDNL